MSAPVLGKASRNQMEWPIDGDPMGGPWGTIQAEFVFMHGSVLTGVESHFIYARRVLNLQLLHSQLHSLILLPSYSRRQRCSAVCFWRARRRKLGPVRVLALWTLAQAWTFL